MKKIVLLFLITLPIITYSPSIRAVSLSKKHAKIISSGALMSFWVSLLYDATTNQPGQQQSIMHTNNKQAISHALFLAMVGGSTAGIISLLDQSANPVPISETIIISLLGVQFAFFIKGAAHL